MLNRGVGKGFRSPLALGIPCGGAPFLERALPVSPALGYPECRSISNVNKHPCVPIRPWFDDRDWSTIPVLLCEIQDSDVRPDMPPWDSRCVALATPRTRCVRAFPHAPWQIACQQVVFCQNTHHCTCEEPNLFTLCKTWGLRVQTGKILIWGWT